MGKAPEQEGLLGLPYKPEELASPAIVGEEKYRCNSFRVAVPLSYASQLGKAMDGSFSRRVAGQKPGQGQGC